MMTWGCSPITALLTSMRSAPPIMDKKDKRANAKRNRRRGPKLGPDAAPLGSASQWIKRTNAPACVAMLMMS
jgi:hypothetical protein